MLFPRALLRVLDVVDEEDRRRLTPAVVAAASGIGLARCCRDELIDSPRWRGDVIGGECSGEISRIGSTSDDA